MIDGVVVGIVVDNADPSGMHRVKVEFPVDAEQPPRSSWVRMVTPMAGKDRGLVILPDVGTEVVLGFAYRTLQPYVLGAVYNGADDTPQPYHNDDGDDNVRIFWSRNDHMVEFDDTPGAERVCVGAKASTRLDVTSGPISQVLDAANKTITESCQGNTSWEAKQTISIKCRDFKLHADTSASCQAGQTAVFASATQATAKAAATQTLKATRIDLNGGSPLQPGQVTPTPTHKHPPST